MRMRLSSVVLAAATTALASHASADPLGPGERFFSFLPPPGLPVEPHVPSPSDFLGYETGERFTRHHQLIDYLTAVAEASDRVTLEQYGWSHQRRPLVILTITSPDNHDRLDEILSANRELTDPRATDGARAAEIARTNPAVQWLSYNVHGNEASCSEAAMQVVYTLAAGAHQAVTDILDNTVVVIDPCLNPDGRERYVGFFQNARGVGVNASPHAFEHHEPWPGARSNHYLFDLNRDWVWGVHPESRSRVQIYRRYMPQLHVDYHEQGASSPYFFGAGDTPYNSNIPQESREWFQRYGEANAEVFDRFGLPYATEERFDYLYPGYGKVLPVYHGAVGLLTEQAGHGRAGLALEVEDDHGTGVVITLRRRAHNHFLTSMSNLTLTANQRQAQLERFYRYFESSLDLPESGTSAYVISADNDPARLAKVRDICEHHGIEIRTLESEVTLSDARAYFPPFDVDGSATVPAGSWVISTTQPMGRLARTLFERDTFLEDIDTYDITSWPVPVLFGVTAFEFKGDPASLSLGGEPGAADLIQAPAPFDGAIALIVPSNQHHFPIALAAAARHNLFARLVDDDIRFSDGRTAPAGSLLVHLFRNDDEAIAEFWRDVTAAALESFATAEGYPPEGPALGNNANERFIRPDIAVLRGDNISSLSYGHTWHMLDIESPTPHTAVDTSDLGRLEWSEFNTLVIPSAFRLGTVFDDDGLEDLKQWIRDGGSVIAINRAAHWASEAILGLDDDHEGDDDHEDGEEEDHSRLSFAEREAESVQDRIPGAVLAADVDRTHPVAAGIEATLGFHVFSDTPLPIDTEDGFAIARFGDIDDQGGPRIGGSISDENLEDLAGTPAVTHHRLGGGNVICFASDPTNRAMNHAGMRLLLNSILLAPSQSSALQPLGANSVHTHNEDDEEAEHHRHRHDR